MKIYHYTSSVEGSAATATVLRLEGSHQLFDSLSIKCTVTTRRGELTGIAKGKFFPTLYRYLPPERFKLIARQILYRYIEKNT